MATRNDPQVPDGFELIKDGTARLIVDGEIWRLRRPKYGEFRKLRELLQQRDDDQVRLIIESASLQSPEDEPENEVDKQLAERIRQRQLNEAVEELNVDWVQEVLVLLTIDKTPPPPDQWPAGMETLGFIKQLIDHWRTVPLARGVG
jgi:hypothetical protein